MLRKLLHLLSGRRLDPTAAWSVREVETPALDLFRRAVGPLAFGAPMADVEERFGRPDRFRWTHRTYCELLYGRAGFQLDFDDGRLAYAAFFLGPDATSPPGVQFCVARLATGLVLSRRTTLADAETALGQPVARDDDGEEHIVVFEREGLTLELETDAAGAPKRCNVFPRG